MEFKVHKKSIKVTVGEKSYDVKVPSVAQQKELQLKIKDVGESGSVDIISNHLVSLGLPLEVLNDLDVDTFLELYEFIHTPKKNSTQMT